MRPGELGREIERLPGVLAATVFADSVDRPRVYLAVETDADIDAIRATTFALLRDASLEPDPDRIHIGTVPKPPPVAATFPSLSLDALDIRRTEDRAQCTVRIRAEGRNLNGTATESDTRTGTARAAVRATLTAVETLDPDLRLGLHGVRRTDLFGFEALTVLVEASVGRSHVNLPGTALVQRSLEHAAALAALQALRTWIP